MRAGLFDHDCEVDDAELVRCEGCETLLDAESCYRDVEGCPLCDECRDAAPKVIQHPLCSLCNGAGDLGPETVCPKCDGPDRQLCMWHHTPKNRRGECNQCSDDWEPATW